MKKYLGKDLKRIQHALNVARYAEQIMKIEGGDPLIVLGAAYLHDIGAHEAEDQYREGEGEYYRHQEMEGVPIAREILERLDIKKEDRERICDMIGHHHHPREAETLNFQILYEAEWLVNMEEKELSQDRKEVQAIIEKYFRTEAGRQLAEKLYLN